MYWDPLLWRLGCNCSSGYHILRPRRILHRYLADFPRAGLHFFLHFSPHTFTVGDTLWKSLHINYQARLSRLTRIYGASGDC